MLLFLLLLFNGVLVPFLVPTRFGQNLDLVENGHADEEFDGEGPAQPVIVELELVGKLLDLSPNGVGVWKGPAAHNELLFRCLKGKAQKISLT